MIEFAIGQASLKIHDMRDLDYLIKKELIDSVVDILYTLAVESPEDEDPNRFDLGGDQR
jgi:hypothetical protein